MSRYKPPKTQLKQVLDISIRIHKSILDYLGFFVIRKGHQMHRELEFVETLHWWEFKHSERAERVFGFSFDGLYLQIVPFKSDVEELFNGYQTISKASHSYQYLLVAALEDMQQLQVQLDKQIAQQFMLQTKLKK